MGERTGAKIDYRGTSGSRGQLASGVRHSRIIIGKMCQTSNKWVTQNICYHLWTCWTDLSAFMFEHKSIEDGRDQLIRDLHPFRATLSNSDPYGCICSNCYWNVNISRHNYHRGGSWMNRSWYTKLTESLEKRKFETKTSSADLFQAWSRPLLHPHFSKVMSPCITVPPEHSYSS